MIVDCGGKPVWGESAETTEKSNWYDLCVLAA